MGQVKFGSVCSGIEAASVAWHPLGWKAAWLSEIEAFPSAVLAHHYPDVPNLGDMTQLTGRILSGEVEAPDLFCGGTPCQAFSVAGLRQSLSDARGNLSLTFCEIANAIDHVRRAGGQPPAIVFWENVPGVLSTKDNAFGCFISALAGCDTAIDPLATTGWTDAGVVAGPRRTVAWRILDAQYFGLAQRRRRVFVVASARDGFDPAAVLFESEGVRRDSPPSRESGKETTGSTGDGIARCITAGEMKRQDWETCNMVTQPVAVGTDCYNGAITGDVAATMGTPGSSVNASGPTVMQPVAPSLTASNDPSRSPQSSEVTQQVAAVLQASMQVRRLTPVECERLQGFPDGYTNIPWRKAAESPDGPRYKALGNSWAVPVVRWIGKRIQDEINKDENHE